MSSLVVYPAIFNQEGNNYNVTFPDIPEVMTFGNGIDHAVEMAQEALGLAIYNKTELPTTSDPRKIKLNNETDFVLMVTLDLNEYRRKFHSKSVRKNTSIPEWINDLAEKENINFSQTLTEALKNKLNV